MCSDFWAEFQSYLRFAKGPSGPRDHSRFPSWLERLGRLCFLSFFGFGKMEIPDTTAPCSLINWLDISPIGGSWGQPPVPLGEMICGTRPMPSCRKPSSEVCWRLYFSLP